jgi:hydroxymethylglutaryl-CoA lyase
MSRWPTVEYKEEALREGMQIESAEISVADKVRLLEAVSDTGLRTIVVGSFVRPEYTPQMARIEEIVSTFRPRAGVTYTALLLNPKAAERARQYCPPLTIDESQPRLAAHLCDVFARRNINRSSEQVRRARGVRFQLHRQPNAGRRHGCLGTGACLVGQRRYRGDVRLPG